IALRGRPENGRRHSRAHRRARAQRAAQHGARVERGSTDHRGCAAAHERAGGGGMSSLSRRDAVGDRRGSFDRRNTMTGPKMLAAAALAAMLMAGTTQAQNYTVKLVAGSPGYDHIQPFMAEQMKFWDKYGLKVDFIGGNYIRSNQMMSIGDFDAGYNQVASAIRYNSAGIPNIIVAPSSATSPLIIASRKVNGWADLKGKRFGIVTKFDMQYLTLTKHILPRFGLAENDVQLAQVPVPEVAAGLLTGDVAAAFPFEPYGTNALSKGAKLLLDAKDMIDKSKINSDMLRNALVLNKKFITEKPELAKRIVWAHLDAIH